MDTADGKLTLTEGNDPSTDALMITMITELLTASFRIKTSKTRLPVIPTDFIKH